MDTLKKCFKCNTEKPLSEFYKHKAMGDGHLGKCKECTKKDVKKHREDNHEKVIAYDRSRNMLPHRISARQEYSKTEKGKQSADRARKKYVKTEKGKEKMVMSRKEYIRAYPLRRAANIILRNAVRYKKIIKPRQCSVCDKIGKIHGHHDDYYKPLDVKWFCAQCHKDYHKKVNNGHS